MEEMKDKIKRLNKEYYDNNNSVVDDKEYDRLVRELEDLEAKNPHLVEKDSPTQKVGYKPNKKFTPYTHPTPMLSLANAMNFEELKKFIDKTNKKFGSELSYVVTPKIDGLALELIYKEGNLVVASTRGDGIVGEDVTQNALEVEGIPHKLKQPIDVVVRGEVTVKQKNSRNFVAGTMRQLDSKVVKERKLMFIPYFIDTDKPTYFEQLLYLKDLGFDGFKSVSVGPCFENVKDFCEEKPSSFEYDMDGFVIKVNKLEKQAQLGTTSKFPRYSIAYKLPTRAFTAILRGISFQIGRMGTITPVGLLEPTQIDGVVVSRVTLNNEEDIKRKDLRINDVIEITRSGGVIPKVIGVKDITQRTGDEKEIIFPKECPRCKGALEKNACISNQCPGKLEQRFLHFVSRGAFNIKGIGPSLIKKLIEKKALKELGDLFHLQNEELVSEKVLTNIENAKTIPLAKFIYSLGIFGIGQQKALELANKFKTIDKVPEVEGLVELKKILDSGINFT